MPATEGHFNCAFQFVSQNPCGTRVLEGSEQALAPSTGTRIPIPERQELRFVGCTAGCPTGQLPFSVRPRVQPPSLYTQYPVSKGVLVEPVPLSEAV